MLTAAPTLETERLVLRPRTRADFDRLVALYRTPRSRYIGGPLGEKAVWANFMNGVGHWAVMGFGAWGIDLKATGECVGEVAVTQPAEYPEVELGWALFDGCVGRGYALEAATRAKRFAFEDVRVPTLVSYIDPDNARSIRLAERLGGVRDPAAATPENAPTLVFRYARP